MTTAQKSVVGELLGAESATADYRHARNWPLPWHQKLIATGRDVEGKIVFLEVGSSLAGLQHIIERHAVDFINKGISQIDIPSVVMETVTKGRVVGMNGSVSVYQVMYNGSAKYISVGLGSSGFIVSANPVSE